MILPLWQLCLVDPSLDRTSQCSKSYATNPSPILLAHTRRLCAVPVQFAHSPAPFESLQSAQNAGRLLSRGVIGSRKVHHRSSDDGRRRQGSETGTQRMFGEHM